MKHLLVTPKNQKELQLIQAVLNKMNIQNAILSENKKDIGMGILMGKIDRNKKVSRNAVMRKLK